MPRGHVYSQRTNERLDDRMVAEGRETRETIVLRSETRRARWNAGLKNLEDDRQSCCNTRTEDIARAA